MQSVMEQSVAGTRNDTGRFDPSVGSRNNQGHDGNGNCHGNGRGRGGSGAAQSPPTDTAAIGLWVFLTSVTMLFMGVTASYIVRRVGPGWDAIPLPPILWLNTAILLAGSFVLARTVRWVKEGNLPQVRQGIRLAVLLGLAFVAGQLVAWQQLHAAGAYLASSAHSGFFYVFTGLHGLHILGGVVVLGRGAVQVAKATQTGQVTGMVQNVARYWHFMDGLWLYLFGLLYLI